MSTRLFVILARNARVGAVLRRGPTRQVLLLRWDLADDAFEAGQWFNGRVYERRCDLSPDGDRFIYFAGTHQPPLGTWTAVSRLPYFSALALWPKGDAWGGGGLFRTGDHILVNHLESEMVLHDGLQLPKEIAVSQTTYPGAGEDSPLYDERLRRDGWTCVDEGTWGEHSLHAPLAFTASRPETWITPSPLNARITRRARTLGLGEREGSWYVMDYDLLDADGEFDRDLGRIDWADWDSTGDLLIACDGRLQRLRAASTGAFDGDPRVLIDLSGLTFAQRPPPPEAMRWDGPRPRGIRLP